MITTALDSDSKATNITLAAHRLSRKYGDHAVIHDIDIQLKHGEVLGLLGPNGAGKSTTLRMLTGNLAPSSGRVEICGIDLLDEPQQAKMHLGFLPEIPPLYIDMSVDAYLLLVARLHRIPKEGIPVALQAVKQRCGLIDCGNRSIKTLSKGFQQRVGIAQAIVHDPDVIILDEPTVGLDPGQMRDMRQLIRELGNEHSVILSTHILSEVESICDRVQIMHRGHIVFDQSIAALKQQPAGLEQIFLQFTQD